MAPGKLLGILLLLLVFLKNARGSNSKKIKIHVPYYVKHIHHYKKVYVPKVQVVKHEHLHKKEYEHHHHHDHHDHGYHHNRGYDKSSDGGFQADSFETFYDEIDHRSFEGNKRPAKSRPRVPFHKAGHPDTYSERSSEETSNEEDYVTGPEELERPSPPPRVRPTPIVTTVFRKPVRVRGWADRKDVVPTAEIGTIPTSGTKMTVKRVVTRLTS